MNPEAASGPDAVFAPLPLAGDAATGGKNDAPRYVVHLPVTGAADQAQALRFAYALARSLALVPGIEIAGTTVSAEDAQHVRQWVFCDRIMPDRRRCRGRAGHGGPCDADG
ncbi:hypothetical protein ACIG87_24200 [Micromonospora sp. NPDC051925]|uniref:hypothetical protein n=1 Tax=Micromonospora sp. NPDC051925 TaxID=3364288 RepID=UPI0037C8B2D8